MIPSLFRLFLIGKSHSVHTVFANLTSHVLTHEEVSHAANNDSDTDRPSRSL